LHAHAADLAGAKLAELSLADGATAGDAKRALGQAFPALADLLATAALATDHEYLRDTAPLAAETSLHLIPPVSGG
jgi:molybdopterin converting factor small subunit